MERGFPRRCILSFFCLYKNGKWIAFLFLLAYNKNSVIWVAAGAAVLLICVSAMEPKDANPIF